MRVAVETLGCKLNQAESDSLLRQLLAMGYQQAKSSGEVEVYILNTCTVTHIADRKARHLLRLSRRNNPGALIVAAGCYAQRAPEELAQLGVVDLILSNKASLIDMAEAEFGKGAKPKMGISVDGSPIRTRALVKIQDGCDDFCSFCIVPYTRGRECSMPSDGVVEEVKARVAEGYREAILTGTKIGAYGQNGRNPAGLVHLIERILAETEIERLRLSSLQPQELTPELVKLWADPRLCHHLHIPLQSGSDSVLQRMRRRYSVAGYNRAIYLAHQAIPDLAVTTDVLVGFPGETDREFEESFHFCHSIGFANIHIFPYSPRPGTQAARMPHQVEDRVKKERTQRMLALAQQSAQCFREKSLGRIMPVLWEREIEQGIWSGLTDNYLRIFAKSQGNLTNQLLPVRLVAQNKGLWGEIVS